MTAALDASQHHTDHAGQNHSSIRHMPSLRIPAIGQTVPKIRLTAFFKGDYMCMDPAALSGRWIVLCFISSLSPSTLAYADGQAKAFASEGAALLIATSHTSLFDVARHNLQSLTVPVLADSLNRMHRAYGVALDPTSTTVVTFLIDPVRVLQFHIAHDLSMWDLDGLRGLLRTNRRGSSGPLKLCGLAARRTAPA